MDVIHRRHYISTDNCIFFTSCLQQKNKGNQRGREK
jgi:hypothetical protein